jgi:alkanesulfonate monooxygenase SsuD/methylene tetrahydromethanopterin reductase-like flavin-dependent oxidoreductase (luciferase family)
MAAGARGAQAAVMPTFGLHLTGYPVPGASGSVAAYAQQVAAAAEESGVFGTLWLTDHLQNRGPGGPAPAPEPHLVLAAIAARTERVDLGVLAASVVYRNPALLAKMITTLDALSGGRAVLGIGAGHPRTQGEAEAYDYAFPPVRTRMDLLDQALQVIRPMIGPEPGGRPNSPRPVRAGGIPVLVAGSGEQRLLRIAAKHADMINLSLPSGDILARIPHKLDVLRRHCATVGRDPARIRVTYKATMAVADSRDQARAAWDQWAPSFGLTEPAAADGAFVGQPADIAAMARPFLDAGVDHLIVELAGGASPDSVALAAKALAPLAGS